jgi:hypothetical protein
MKVGIYKSFWQMEAARKAPGFGYDSIIGDGQFALITYCKNHRRIYLFDDADRRLRKLQQFDRGCSSTCTGTHEFKDLAAE